MDLPEPVGPVTSTRPRGSPAKLPTTAGTPSVLERLDLVRDHAESGADRLALLVDVHAEPGQAADGVGRSRARGSSRTSPAALREERVERAAQTLGLDLRSNPSSALSEPLMRTMGGVPAVRCTSDAPASTISVRMLVDREVTLLRLLAHAADARSAVASGRRGRAGLRQRRARERCRGRRRHGRAGLGGGRRTRADRRPAGARRAARTGAPERDAGPAGWSVGARPAGARHRGARLRGDADGRRARRRDRRAQRRHREPTGGGPACGPTGR